MAAINTPQDSFNDNSLGALWGAPVEYGANIFERNGQLEIGWSGNATIDQGADISTTNSYDLTSSSVTLEVPREPNVATHAQGYFRIVADGNNWFQFMQENGTLNFDYTKAAAFTNQGTAAYSATNCRWMRFRESVGTIFWETSPDSVNWTTRTSFVHGMTITAMTIYLAVYAYQAETAPGYIYLDNLNLPRQARFNNSGIRPRPFAPGIAR